MAFLSVYPGHLQTLPRCIHPSLPGVRESVSTVLEHPAELVRVLYGIAVLGAFTRNLLLQAVSVPVTVGTRWTGKQTRKLNQPVSVSVTVGTRGAGKQTGKFNQAVSKPVTVGTRGAGHQTGKFNQAVSVPVTVGTRWIGKQTGKLNQAVSVPVTVGTRGTGKQTGKFNQAVSEHVTVGTKDRQTDRKIQPGSLCTSYSRHWRQQMDWKI